MFTSLFSSSGDSRMVRLLHSPWATKCGTVLTRDYKVVELLLRLTLVFEMGLAFCAWSIPKHGVAATAALVWEVSSGDKCSRVFARCIVSLINFYYQRDVRELIPVISFPTFYSLSEYLSISYLVFWLLVLHIIYRYWTLNATALSLWRQVNDYVPEAPELPACTVHRDGSNFILMNGEGTTLGTAPIVSSMIKYECNMQNVVINGEKKITPVMTKCWFTIKGDDQPNVVQPESFVPNSFAERAPPPSNTIYFWIQLPETGKWVKHSTNQLWKAPFHTSGHGLTHTRHAFEQLRDVSVKDLQISGPNMVRLPYLAVSKTGRHPCEAWETCALRDPNFKHPGVYEPDVSDLFMSCCDLNFSLLSVRMKPLEAETSFGAHGKVYCVSNKIAAMEGVTRGRLKEDAFLVTQKGVSCHCLSAGKGTSGGSIESDATGYLLAIHIAGHEKVEGKEFPNFGIPGTVVAQLMRKYSGQSPLPYYSQAFENSFDAHLAEAIKMEEAEALLGLSAPMLPPIKDAVDAIRGEAAVDPAVWRGAIRKLRRATKNNNQIKALLYRKVSQRIPEYDPESTPEDEELWALVEEEIRDQIYGDCVSGECEEVLDDFVECVEEPALQEPVSRIIPHGYGSSHELQGFRKDLEEMRDFRQRLEQPPPPGLRFKIQPDIKITPESFGDLSSPAEEVTIRSYVLDKDIPPPRHYTDDVKSCIPSTPVSDDVLTDWDLGMKHIFDNLQTMTLLEFLEFSENHLPTLYGHTRNGVLFQQLIQPEARVDPIGTAVDEDVLTPIGKVPYKTRNKSKAYDEDGIYQNVSIMDQLRKYNLLTKDGKLRGNWPAEGPAAEKSSLISQLRQKLVRKRGYDAQHLMERVKGLPAGRWDWNMSFKTYLQGILKAMDPVKNAGWSTLMDIKTKGEWATSRRCLESGLYTVCLLLKSDHDFVVSMSPRELFFNGYILPEEDSVKPEIHKLSKLPVKVLEEIVEEGRWRLIWRTSGKAEFVTRFFHDIQNKTEITLFQAGYTHSEKFPYFGSSPGMGHDDEGISRTVDSIKRLFEGRIHTNNNGVGLDAKGWDFGVSRELWGCDGWRRAYLASETGAPMCFVMGCLNLSMALSAHVVRIGTILYAINIFGIMGSGSSSTSASNSFMREHIHSEAFWCLDTMIALALTMGDDLIGRDLITEEHKQIWKDLGMRMEDETKLIPVGQPVPFTSHLYNLEAETATFDNVDKLMLRLVLSEAHKNFALTRDMACGILFAVRHTPEALVMVEDYVQTKLPQFRDVDWTMVEFNPVTVF